LKLPAEKLWVTVFEEDADAERIWLEKVGVSPERFSRIGAKDNFWAMGDTGPCGPCTEIFYDHGAHIAGGPPGTPEEDGDRYIEIWNLVFMQYNRDKSGKLNPLPKPSVDTGMGLERVAAILQNVHSNYEIDTFVTLIGAAAKYVGTQDLNNKSLRVIADHIRAAAFLILDGVLPSNEGRGYVLRRIIRRALRHGNQLGAKGVFFSKLVKDLCEVMGQAYPDLVAQKNQIASALLHEEGQFAKTLQQGLQVLEAELKKQSGTELSGDVAFKLYDTFGFPVDLTADVLRDRDMTVDMTGFEVAMAKQKTRSKSVGQFKAQFDFTVEAGASEFLGYDALAADVEVEALYVDGNKVEALEDGQSGLIILKATPFYAEAGGQVGDTGVMTSGAASIQVQDTQKQGNVIVHHGVCSGGTIIVGDIVQAGVDADKRAATAQHHSATHLLHAVMRSVLGEHVQQKGSRVSSTGLRFDFSHNKALSERELTQVELQVNASIMANVRVETIVTNQDEAKKLGAMALFGEKYGSEVRVLKMGELSMELCGGTHVTRTGDIGLFKMVSEGAIASGVRRIEAHVGLVAVEHVQHELTLVRGVSEILSAPVSQLAQKAKELKVKLKAQEKTIASLQGEVAAASMGGLCDQAVDVNGVKVLAARVDDVDAKALRGMVDDLKKQLGSAVIILGQASNGRVSLVVGVTDDLTGMHHAGKIIGQVAQQVGGKGGGRADMAQAGGTDVDKLDAALVGVQSLLQ
jgi:alanyl-tRNA synthetase